MKTKMILSAFILFLATTGILLAMNRDEGMEPAENFFLPQGDPEAGRKAFSDLKCTSCHWAANEVDLSAPVAEKPGPMLGDKQAHYTSGWIANSIVSPSHTIAYGSHGEADDSELSRMGDFKDVMTVRQLIDIVSYIQSMKQEYPGTLPVPEPEKTKES